MFKYINTQLLRAGLIQQRCRRAEAIIVRPAANPGDDRCCGGDSGECVTDNGEDVVE